MARTRTTWNQKLEDSKGLPKLEPVPEKWCERWGEGQMLIPAPLEVNALMRTVPKGKLTTIEQIRECLARKHGAAVACPMTTGILHGSQPMQPANPKRREFRTSPLTGGHSRQKESSTPSILEGLPISVSG